MVVHPTAAGAFQCSTPWRDRLDRAAGDVGCLPRTAVAVRRAADTEPRIARGEILAVCVVPSCAGRKVLPRRRRRAVLAEPATAHALLQLQLHRVIIAQVAELLSLLPSRASSVSRCPRH